MKDSQTFSGIVQKGDQRGEALGFKTANIPISDNSISGVYFGRVKVGEETYDAVCFGDEARHLLEAHLLDFNADLYGWQISIELLHKLRERKRFKDDETLKKAIADDIRKAQAYFAHTR